MVDFEHFRLAVTYLQFLMQVCFSATVSISVVAELLFSFGNHIPWPMTLTFQYDLDRLKVNR